MQLVVVVSSFNLALTFKCHIFSLLIVYFSIITLNKGNVGTNHLNNRILLFVCNRKVIYYYYITLPSITITITFGNFQTITITGKSGYYILQLHVYYYYPIPDISRSCYVPNNNDKECLSDLLMTCVTRVFYSFVTFCNINIQNVSVSEVKDYNN